MYVQEGANGSELHGKVTLNPAERYPSENAGQKYTRLHQETNSSQGLLSQ